MNRELPPAEPVRLSVSGGAMLYDGSRIGNATETAFDPDYWRTHGKVPLPRPARGAALFVEHSGGSWVLRHRRGGFMARISRDRYLWTGEARTRPFSEWRLLRELYREDCRCPLPWRHGIGAPG